LVRRTKLTKMETDVFGVSATGALPRQAAIVWVRGVRLNGVTLCV
jgi:hypothetical protein